MKTEIQASAPPDDAVAAAPAQPRTRREATFDILKGIGIVEVMLHHVLGFGAHKYSVEGATDWWVMSIAHQVLHFAVPMFLLASALLLARSLASKPVLNWKQFFARRWERTLWPYIVWSLLYIGFRLWIVRAPEDVQPTVVSLPFGSAFAVPALISKAASWRAFLFWGKAYFHLYFLAVLLQFSILFPLLYAAFRRFRLRFGAVLLISAVLQLLFYYLNAWVLAPKLGFSTPASSVMSYIIPTLLGVWLGLNWGQWPTIWRAWRWPVIIGTLAGTVGYMTLSVKQLLNQDVGGIEYNTTYAIYAAGASLLLLAAAQYLGRGGRTGRVLARIGEWSLPLFLVHPLFFFFFSGPRIGKLVDMLPFSALWLFAAIFALTWGITEAVKRLRIDELLFGRSLKPLWTTSQEASVQRSPA